MNSLERALLEKLGHDNGFERILASQHSEVRLGSARHRVLAVLRQHDSRFVAAFEAEAQPLLPVELHRAFPVIARHDGHLIAADHAQLAQILRRAAELGHALPNQAAEDYDTRLKEELAAIPPQLKGTEVERMVRQRVGQDVFRRAMLDYWGGACAVTGIAVPEVLRASHARPWAKCDTDAERLDVFNGFLLSANLDALFDRYLISFDEGGGLLISRELGPDSRLRLGLKSKMRLRWMAPAHLPYLVFHRTVFGKMQEL